MADRLVEIKEELKDTELSYQDRIKLEEELALATQNTTEAERERAKLLSEETETERIIRETEEKKAQLQEQLENLEQARLDEIATLEELTAEKLRIEQLYTERFKAELKVREDAQLASIEKIQREIRNNANLQTSLSGQL